MIDEGSEDLTGLQVSSDELGRYVAISVDTSVYSRSSVLKTAYWFTDQYYVFIDRVDNDNAFLRVELRSKVDREHDSLTSSARELCNSLLDQQVRDLVSKETGHVRDFLIKKSFFEGSKHLDPALLHSDETAIPSPNQSYDDDALEISSKVNA